MAAHAVFLVGSPSSWLRHHPPRHAFRVRMDMVFYIHQLGNQADATESRWHPTLSQSASPFPGAGSGGFSRGWGVGAGPVVLEGRSLFFLSLNCLRACFKIDDKAFFGHSSAITCRAASAFKGWCAVRTLRDFARKEPRFEEKTRFQGKSSTRNEFSNRLLARRCTFKQCNRRCQSSVEEKRERF